MMKKWNLQIFAEGDGVDSEGTGDNLVNSTEEGKGNNPEGEGEKKYTDKDVDDIVNKKFAKWKVKHEKDLEDAKNEAAKLAKMNADQKKDYELQKAMNEIAELRRQAARTELAREATRILKESKIDATQDILDFVVGDDAEKTQANITKFVEIIESQVKAAEIARSKGRTPKAYNGSTGSLKKNEILAIKDYDERQKAIAENINLFR